jgi:hypothetical protein
MLLLMCSCQLFEGVAACAEPLPLVAVEDLGAWVQGQQAAGGAASSVEDWSTLGTLQVGATLQCVRVCRHGEYMGTCKLTYTVLLDSNNDVITHQDYRAVRRWQVEGRHD